ncbi:MAG: GNAT family N-acetyltransferase [Alphaproteobacteria bacterium]
MAREPYCEVRRLGADDIGLFHEMLAMFGAAFEEPATYTGSPPGERYVRDLLAADGFIALAAVKDETVVGGLAAYVLRKFEKERAEIYVYDLAVALPHRRRGVATALLDAVVRIAEACGAHAVFVQADLGDGPAIALYGGRGRREDVLHFDLDL